MRPLLFVLPLALSVTVPVAKAEEPRQRIRIVETVPVAPTALPHGAFTPELAIAPVVPKPAVPKPPEASPETLEWREHCRILEERGIGRGDEIGGNAAFGIRLGGKGQANQLGELDPAVLDAVSQWNEQGALVLSVVPGSPAEIAGLEPGDIVVQIAGVWVDTPNMLVRLASRAEVGRELEVRYLREGNVDTTWMSAIDRSELSRQN